MKLIAASGSTILCALGFGLLGCRMPAGDTPLTAAVDRRDAGAVKTLIAQGSDPNGHDGFGLTPLVRASRSGDVASATALLDGGADIELFDHPPTRDGWSPLMNAVHKDRKKIVGVLLARGTDPNRAGARGLTALVLASSDAGPDVVRMLLEAGADPRRGENGSAALTVAAQLGHKETVRVLLASAPDLRLEAGPRGTAARWLARLRGMDDVLGIAGPKQAAR